MFDHFLRSCVTILRAHPELAAENLALVGSLRLLMVSNFLGVPCARPYRPGQKGTQKAKQFPKVHNSKAKLLVTRCHSGPPVLPLSCSLEGVSQPWHLAYWVVFLI